MFSGKTVIITGSSSGLGKCLALEFAKTQAHLVLFARNEVKLKETEKLCREWDSVPLIVTGDVTKPEDCKRLIKRTIERYGSLDYMIANAGISMWAKFEDIEDISLFRRMMETNYLGAVHCTYYALPYLRKNKGMVVAISSIQGKIGVPFHTGYVASKHAVQGFFNSLRIELNSSGVGILVVLPHWLRGTQLRKNAFGKDGNALGEYSEKQNIESISLERCCHAILKAMLKRKKELVVPPKLKVLPWLHLISPGIVDYIVKRKIRM